MALFKIFRGNSLTLPKTYKDGYCYFTIDDGKMYIDTKDNDSTGRICLNAKHADTADLATNATNAQNADKLDGYHESSFLRYRKATSVDGEETPWTGLSITEYHGAYPDEITNKIYNWGQVITLSGDSSRFELFTNHNSSTLETSNGIQYRSGWGDDKKPWNMILDSKNFDKYALPITGGTLTGSLKVGEKLELWTDSEGGNIRFTSPAGNRWSIDAIDNTALRFVWEETIAPFHFYNDGSLYANGALAIGGNITFNSIGDSGTSHGLVWNGSNDGANIYYRTDGSDKGRLVFNLRDDDNTYICFAKNGADFANIDTAGYFSGSAYAAHLLKPTHNASTTSTWASDWTANVADHSGVKVWGQAFANSTLPNDSGDIVLWLNNSTTLNMTIDGHFYQDCNKLVLDDNNYSNYALPITGGTMYGDIHMTQGYALHGYMGGGSDHWYLRGEGSDDNGYLSLTLSDNGDEFFDINFWHYDGYSTSTFRTTTAQTHIFNKLYVYSPNNNSIEMQVCNNYTNGVRLRADNEGGNINIYSGNGHTNFWEIDSYNGDLRIYTWRESDGNYSGAVRIGQESGCLYGAVWNDYAEYRNQEEEIEPGYIVISTKNGKVKKTTKHLSPFDGVVSDTFGFAIGENDECKTPLAVAGRVLVYCEGDRNSYDIGDVVCASENGKACKMTREEIKEYPDRIVGTVSEIPDYDTWGQNPVKVNNRIWIKVK